MLGSIRLNGATSYMAIEGATDSDVFREYVRQMLGPTLRPGDIVTTTWTYYLGPGIDQVVMRTDGTNKQWYYRDGHGSISAVADNSGNVLEQYEYDTQGHFQIENGSGTVLTLTGIGNMIMYTGRSYDAEMGNYFYRARYYNLDLGRFLSRDPLSGAEFSQGRISMPIA